MRLLLTSLQGVRIAILGLAHLAVQAAIGCAACDLHGQCTQICSLNCLPATIDNKLLFSVGALLVDAELDIGHVCTAGAGCLPRGKGLKALS